MKASSESQALWSFTTMVTTGMAFQMAPEICLLPYRNSTCCLPRAGFTPLSPEWKPNLLFKNLSKHKNKSCPCRYVRSLTIFVIHFLIIPSGPAWFPILTVSISTLWPPPGCTCCHPHVLRSVPQHLIGFLCLLLSLFYAPRIPDSDQLSFFQGKKRWNVIGICLFKWDAIKQLNTAQDKMEMRFDQRKN